MLKHIYPQIAWVPVMTLRVVFSRTTRPRRITTIPPDDCDDDDDADERISAAASRPPVACNRSNRRR